jgi:prepilin-type N-terminal cleavage/methylation domain-containing protein
MRDPAERGFSLVELAIVLVVMGLLFGFSIPSFQRLSSTYQLRGATENIAGQLRLAREKAIATGVDQPIHIPSSTVYHIHYASGVSTAWTLPNGITFTNPTIGDWYYMAPDGRFYQDAAHTATGSNIIVVGNARGELDTVSVQLSGLILIR